MSHFQLQVLLTGLAILATAGLLMWSVTWIRYEITARHLRITWLGLPVRWIRLSDVKRVGHRAEAWAERWPNVLFERRRTLVIRRHRGLCKTLLITPKYPFEFKAALEHARDLVVASTERGLSPQASSSASGPAVKTLPAPKPESGENGAGTGAKSAA